MSAISADEETQMETQGNETQYEETQNLEDDVLEAPVSEVEEVPGPKAKVSPAQTSKQPEREPGKSLFPFSKVQKIIKADKEIPIVAKEATFLISLATEEFIKRLCQAGQQVAHNERRSTVQHKDIVTVVRKADEFLFLEEIMPLSAADAPAKKQKAKAVSGGPSRATMLDQFVAGKRKEDGTDEGGDYVMNEDGTMYAAGNADSEDEL